jgi:hypothetical protein
MHPPENLTNNSLAFGKMATPMFPFISKPKPNTLGSKNKLTRRDDHSTFSFISMNPGRIAAVS